ncbi:tyrosine-type recombinase/integrase [Crocosphaera chwakensis]|uniref:Phage integrase n=1 Tax=Crocosphaera chwakensis CCY0110 TaxID=391612 RepID=A3IZH7_9CHRO|nr:tyrosine-type recombinase/integrase [Crocosphaera chwakensis]EAZ88118.1 phage integrase [Crocosphaera chwakensis CCY0110]
MSSIISTFDAKPVLDTATAHLNVFEDFLKHHVGEGSAESDTIRTYRCHIKQFLQWCQNTELNPIEATFNQLTRFRHWLIHQQQYQNATISLKLTILRRFYDGLREYGYIINNPAIRLKAPTAVRDPAASINFLENEEMNRLLDSLPTENTVHALRDRLLISLMVLQGCRTVDLHRVTMENMVKNGKNIGLRVSSKRHTRVVPLTPDLAKLLRRYLRARRKAGELITESTPLFISVAWNNKKIWKPLSRRSFRRIVDKYLGVIGLKELPCPKTLKKLTGSQEKSNLPTKAREFSQHKPKPRKLSPHSLRHTAATLALRAGATLEQVQDLLGHTDPKTTMVYVHIGDRWLNNPALLLSVNKPKLGGNIIKRFQRLQQSLKRINPLDLTLNEEETLRILDQICA